MTVIKHILIIYNPASTGSGLELAGELKTQLQPHIKASVSITATQYAGHAEQLAYKTAMKQPDSLIISSSGDGGYNEVINGAMRATSAGKKPVCAVLPAGNANDHRRATQKAPLAQAIMSGSVTEIDILQLNVRSPTGESSSRYAHSYIGLGLTPVVAAELNRHTLNAIKELIIVLKAFWSYRPFEVEIDSQKVALDSLIFSNIRKMSKVIKVARNAKPNDRQFEVNSLPHGRKLLLLGKLLKAVTKGLKGYPATSYSLKLLSKMPIQLDGEVQVLEKGSQITVKLAEHQLRTIV